MTQKATAVENCLYYSIVQ